MGRRAYQPDLEFESPRPDLYRSTTETSFETPFCSMVTP